VATMDTAPQAYTLYTPDIERSGLVLDMLCLKPKTAKINLGLNYRATYIPELPYAPCQPRRRLPIQQLPTTLSARLQHLWLRLQLKPLLQLR